MSGTEAMIISAVIGSMSASKSRSSMNRQMALDREERAKAQAQFNKRIEKYEKSEYVPLDIDALKTENIYEDVDLTKDVLPAADYAREQFQQQQANIMQGLRGAAGASGIAGLAQALSGQAARQARETGLSIGAQLAQGRRLALQERSQKQLLERQVKLSNMQGKNAFELDKMATLLGVSGQRAYAATQAIQSGMTNMANIQAAQMQMYGNMGTAAAGMDWSNFGGGGTGSGSGNTYNHYNTGGEYGDYYDTGYSNMG